MCVFICWSVHIFLHLLGDDWEHEETFTDDDEAVGNDPEEREDLAPEIPAPPEIKQVSFAEVYGMKLFRLMATTSSSNARMRFDLLDFFSSFFCIRFDTALDFVKT